MPRASRWAFAVATASLAGFALLAGWVASGTAPDAWDVRVQRRLLGLQDPDLRGLAWLGAGLGAPWLLAVAAVLGAVWLWWRVRRPTLVTALLVVPLATAGVVQLLTLAFAGQRPAAGDVLGLPVLGGSFPSAPTADATAVWGLLALAVAGTAGRLRTWVLCALGWLLLSGAVAWHQLLLGKSPSDVLGGWLLGVAVVTGCCGLLAGWARAPVSVRADRPAATLGR